MKTSGVCFFCRVADAADLTSYQAQAVPYAYGLVGPEGKKQAPVCLDCRKCLLRFAAVTNEMVSWLSDRNEGLQMREPESE